MKLETIYCEYANDLARHGIECALTYMKVARINGAAINPDPKGFQKKMKFYATMTIIKD